MYIYMHAGIYINIYKERVREGERERQHWTINTTW